ncbi:MAG: methyl-accepting chemotaxis protein [Desulfuromonadaceae bacterium]
MLKQLKLGGKLLIAFLMIGLFPFLILGGISLRQSSQSLSEQAFNQLESIREIKKSQIEGFFSERFGDIRVLSANDLVVAALQDFETAYHNDGQRVGGELWKEVEQKYGKWLTTYKEEYGYYDLFLISTGGDVVYTVAKESDWGENLKHGSLQTSSLAEAYQGGLNQTTLVDFKPYAPSNNEPASFIAAPAMDKSGNVIGVVALQLSLEAINAVMTQRAGMGASGESYLIGADYLMRSDSYLDPQNHSVKASFANPQLGSVKTEAAKAALSGQADKKIITDYNGNPVLSAYTPLHIGDLKWAMLVEIDEVEAFASVKTLQQVTAVIFVVGLLAIVAAALLIARSITRPVIQAVQLAKEISQGDFSVRLHMKRADEIGQLADALDFMADGLKAHADVAERIAEGNLNVQVKLASEKDQLGRAFQTMTDQLNDIMSQIQVAGDQIAVGSGQISDSSQSLSQGATEQASSLEEISASLNEMSAQTSTTAKNANHAKQLTLEAQGAAENGSHCMQQMMTSMNEINDAAQNISKIIKTIDEIAFQTNLLALNAAVEAARAGQHGKGFAVVAEEVRNLAARSSKAAEETADLIQGSVGKTAHGSSVAKQTAEALQEIVTGVGKVSDLTSEIASASSEQAEGISQINQGVAQIDQVTQQNTANAEESAAAAEELSGQAVQLNQMLRHFTLRQTSHTRSVAAPVRSKTAPVRSKTAPAGGWNQYSDNQSVGEEHPQIELDADEFGKY